MFELLKRDGLARMGELETPHGLLKTPCLLPVINPRNITLSPRELRDEFGFEALITNSYIIRGDATLKQEALAKGLHELLDFPRVIMTDSGTFQSHMYGEVEVSNENIVAFQRDIGADIGTVLDIFTEPEWGKERTSEATRITLQRTEAAGAIKGNMLLAGVVQGSLFPDLREDCARRMAPMSVDIHPIGGVVPLMEQYRFADLVDVIVASKKGLTPERPVHLFGAGHPMIFALAILLGCDMFDSASYAKFGRDDRFMFVDGSSRLEDMRGLDCVCPACRDHTIESLRALPAEERAKTIARHNLYVSQAEIERAKRALLEGNLWELVEQRCRAHPALLDALRRLEQHQEYLERFEPLSRDNSFFYTGTESLDRPVMLRYERRYFERYRQPPTKVLVGFKDAERPFNHVYAAQMAQVSAVSDAHFLVMTPFGPVPMDLDEIYPIAQSVFPKAEDREMRQRTTELMERFSHCQEYGMCVVWEGPETLEMLASIAGGQSTFDLDTARVRAVADYQFGKGAADALFSGTVKIAKSRTTGKIRTVEVDGKHILSMRAPDGFFTLRPEGAKRLLAAFPSPRLRVIVNADSAEFNKEGKNVFCGFALDCDPDLVPMDEAIVVDQNDQMVAIGRVLLTRAEMLAFKKGLAVKVREGVRV
jgi:7-cyano-7-deazaguanine tRNA-ribosyltransferase